MADIRKLLKDIEASEDIKQIAAECSEAHAHQYNLWQRHQAKIEGCRSEDVDSVQAAGCLSGYCDE